MPGGLARSLLTGDNRPNTFSVSTVVRCYEAYASLGQSSSYKEVATRIASNPLLNIILEHGSNPVCRFSLHCFHKAVEKLPYLIDL